MVDEARRKRNEEDRKFIVSSVGKDLVNELRPALLQQQESIKQAIKEAISEIRIEAPSVSVSVPPLEIPKAEIEVKIPEIKVPKPEVIVNVPEVKIPQIKVPKPEVIVKIPEIKIPQTKVEFPDEMEIRGNVGLKGITRDDPLPVLMVDTEGKPLKLSIESLTMLGGGGGARSGIMKTTGDIPKKISDNRQTVTTAGTAVRLVSSSFPCKKVVIQAETDNTGIMAVGDATVVATEGSQRGNVLYTGMSITIEIDDANKLFLNATVSAEGVTFSILE